ncbi:hypothetical protein [Nocardioides sp. GCM10030258]|uniref:hypothetical protein n=1 Tax=unclassified Nocardioides TaxID=2615069 RepID=UPI0036113F4E
MDFAVIDSGGTSRLRLGQRRDDVRATNGTYREFRRTPSSQPADHFLETGPMVSYDANGLAVAIEFAEPAQVTLEGVALIGASLDHLRDALQQVGIAMIDADEGAQIETLRMELYAPSGTVEGVMLGEDSS